MSKLSLGIKGTDRNTVIKQNPSSDISGSPTESGIKETKKSNINPLRVNPELVVK